MRKPHSSLWVLSVLVFLPACVSCEGVALSESPLPPRPPDGPVAVYLPVEAPVSIHKAAPGSHLIGERPVEGRIVGRVDARSGDLGSWEAVMAQALAEARRLGGDAVVLVHWADGSRLQPDGTVGCDKEIGFTVLSGEQN